LTIFETGAGLALEAGWDSWQNLLSLLERRPPGWSRLRAMLLAAEQGAFIQQRGAVVVSPQVLAWQSVGESIEP
jgi:hypothetical protein